MGGLDPGKIWENGVTGQKERIEKHAGIPMQRLQRQISWMP